MTEKAEDDFSQPVAQVITYVKTLELPAVPQSTREARPKRGTQPSMPGTVFDEVRNQAMVVGSDIVSFVAGLSDELRHAIVCCALLAQLAANRQVPDRENVKAWYQAYFETLTRLGWVVQEQGFSEHVESGENFEAHNAIISIASVVLGHSTAALALVQSTLQAMKSMSSGPWMKIFDRESQSARAARFQMTVAEPASEHGASLCLMAFELNATSTLTQVLFFKFRRTDVALHHASGRVTIDAKLLAGIYPSIVERVSDYTRSYVASVPI